MSLKKFIRSYQAIPDPKIISKFIQYLNKTFAEKKFVEGAVVGSKEDKF